MIFAVIGISLLLLIFGPQLWVRYVLNKYAEEKPGMPGTGGELARHLLAQFQLSEVEVEATESGRDHYDPESNKVRLSPEYLEGKSLTAVAVAAHEVGHAIQFNKKEPVSYLRRRHLPKAIQLQKIGAAVLFAVPIVALVTRVPHLMAITAAAGLLTLLSSVIAYAAILPEEWDASFNKALPLLKQGEYVPDEYFPALKQILRACALTYVAGALADVLRLWRLLALFRLLR